MIHLRRLWKEWKNKKKCRNKLSTKKTSLLSKTLNQAQSQKEKTLIITQRTMRTQAKRTNLMICSTQHRHKKISQNSWPKYLSWMNIRMILTSINKRIRDKIIHMKRKKRLQSFRLTQEMKT